MIIIIKNWTGNPAQFIIEIELHDTVAYIKNMIWQKIGFPPDQQILQSGDTRLVRDEMTLDDINKRIKYEIRDESPIYLRFSVRGGSFTRMDKNNMELFGLNPHPVDCHAKPGLNLCSVCTNKKCSIYNESCIRNLFYGEFNAHRLLFNGSCPRCETNSNITQPLFYKCTLIINGQKSTTEEINYTIKINNCCSQCIRPHDNWSSMKITVQNIAAQIMTIHYCHDN